MATEHQAHASGGKLHPRKRFTEGLLDNDLILKELHLAPGQTVMDVGCATGYMAKLFSPAVGDTGTVYAIDVNAAFIENLQDETKGTNIKAMVCDISQPTPVESGTVDLIYISTVMHEQTKEKLAGVIREFQRLLKADGVLAIVEFEKRETPFGPPLTQRYSPGELRQALPFVPLKTVPVAEHFYLQLFRARN